MTEYAEGECATCGAIRPKNEMKVVSVRRVTGKSYGSGSSRTTRNSNSSSFGGDRSARFRSGSSSSNRNSSNTRTHMSRDRVWICKGCRAPKSDMSPTQKNFMWGIIIVAAFFGFRLFDGSGGNRAQSPVEAGQEAEGQEETLSEGFVDSGQSEDLPSEPTESSASDAPGRIEADTSPAEPSDAAAAPTTVTLSKVDRAMQQAFEAGEPVRWEDGDLKGYAVPSPAEGSSGCRSVYYSIDGKEGWQSATKTICP